MRGFGKSSFSRMISAILPLGVATLFFCPAAAGANPKEPLSPAPRVLDKAGVHALYLHGDFKAVIAVIDSFTTGGKPYPRADSIFIAKHLASVYAANPATQELGREYMYTLLALLPVAMILDMYVNDEIDHIFGNVQKEYVERQQSSGKAQPSELESSRYAIDKLARTDADADAAAPEPLVQGDAAKPLHSKGPSPAFFWVAGGMTIAAVAGYYILQSQSEPKPQTTIIEVSP